MSIIIRVIQAFKSINVIQLWFFFIAIPLLITILISLLLMKFFGEEMELASKLWFKIVFFVALDLVIVIIFSLMFLVIKVIW